MELGHYHLLQTIDSLITKFIFVAGCFHDLHETRRLSGRGPSRASRRRQKQAHLVRAVAEAVESRPSTALQAENAWVEKTLQALDRQRTPSR